MIWLASLLSVALPQFPGATLRAEPREVEIGQPIALELVLEHAASERPAPDPAALLPDPSWVLLELGAPLRAVDPADPARATTRIELRVASLDPGERELTLAPLRIGARDQVLPSVSITVRAALHPGEDAPRPARGLREVRDFPAESSLIAPALLFGVLVLAALAALLARRWRRRAPVPEPVLTPLARLEALAGAREAEARATCYELTRILRGALDAHLSRDLAGLTDEEWLAATPPGVLPGEARAALGRLFARAERIKYGVETPTHFSLDELLGEGRGVLGSLEGAEARREAAA